MRNKSAQAGTVVNRIFPTLPTLRGAVFSCLTSHGEMEILPFIIRLMELICSTEGSVPYPQTQHCRSGSINAVNRSAKTNTREVAELVERAVWVVLALISVTFPGSALLQIFQINRLHDTHCKSTVFTAKYMRRLYETLSLISSPPKKSIQAGGNFETKLAELTFGILKRFHNTVLNSPLAVSQLLLEGKK